MQWRTPTGDSLPSVAESSNRDEEGLFTVAASVILTDSSVKNVSCCIQNLLLGQEKEVEISVPGQWNAYWIAMLTETQDNITWGPGQKGLHGRVVYIVPVSAELACGLGGRPYHLHLNNDAED